MMLTTLLLVAISSISSAGGHDDKQVERHLKKMAEHPNWGDPGRLAARDQVVRLGKPALPALIRSLVAEGVREEAAEALAELLAKNKSLVLNAVQSGAVAAAAEKTLYPAVGDLLFAL